MHTHDYHEEEKNFQDILSMTIRESFIILKFKQLLYKLTKDILFQVTVFHDRHSHQEINNSILAESRHTQINEVNHNIDLEIVIYFLKFGQIFIELAYHEYRLNRGRIQFVFEILCSNSLPQILSGASSSSKIG